MLSARAFTPAGTFSNILLQQGKSGKFGYTERQLIFLYSCSLASTPLSKTEYLVFKGPRKILFDIVFCVGVELSQTEKLSVHFYCTVFIHSACTHQHMCLCIHVSLLTIFLHSHWHSHWDHYRNSQCLSGYSQAVTSPSL